MSEDPTRTRSSKHKKARGGRDARKHVERAKGLRTDADEFVPGGGYASRRSEKRAGRGGKARGRGASLNHLVGFSYEGGRHSAQHASSSQRSSAAPSASRRGRSRNRPRGGSGGGGGGGGGNGGSASAPAFCKEDFVQANYRFFVRPGPETLESVTDPDFRVEWSSVEHVVLPCDSARCCPICLEPPTAARITPCGHVFCFPCILRYLGEAGRTWMRCPLCFEPVYAKALKSFEFDCHERVRVGETARFVLLRRFRDCVVPSLPGDGLRSFSIRAGANAAAARFSRVAVLDSLLPVIERERAELAEALDAARAEGQIMLRQQVERAAERASRERAAAALRRQPSTGYAGVVARQEREQAAAEAEAEAAATPVATPVPLPVPPTGDDSPSVEYVLAALNAVSEREEEWRAKHPDTPAPTTTTTTTTSNCSTPAKDADDGDSCYYFYQSSDGQRVFLHSLNYRCLAEEFGSPDRFPAEIEARVLETQGEVQTPALRSRLRFLSHLPLASSVHFAYVDLGGLLSPATAAKFATDMDERRRRLDRRARDSERADRLAQQRADEAERDLMRRALGGVGHGPVGDYDGGGGDDEKFPTLNPLGLAAAAASSPPGSPVPAAGGWSTVASRGLASSDMWQPLAAPAAGAASSSPFGSPPLAGPSRGSPSPPALELGGSPAAPSSSGRRERRSKGGKRTLFATGSQRSYR